MKPQHESAISSVQFSRSVVSDSLRPHESQQARLPCRGPALAESKGYPRDERSWQEKREKTRETNPDRANSAREGERERVTRWGCLQGLAMLYFLP